MREDLCSLQKWCEENGISINTSKTRQMVFGSSHPLGKVTTSNIMLGGEIIEDVNLYNYLGVIMDKQVSFEAHAKKVIERTSGKIMQLRQMYKNMILPVLEYGNILLSATNLDTRRKCRCSQIRH